MPIVVEGVTLPEYNDPADVPASLQTMLQGVLPRIGGVLSGILSMGGNKITNLGTPTAATDAATKAYADSIPQAVMPPGALVPFGGPTTPTGWLLCNGAAVSRSTYADLFAAIGTVHGAGNGTTTFNVPDMRGKFPIGVAASGTASALGQIGGTIDHTHTGPSHTHAGPSHTHLGPSHSHAADLVTDGKTPATTGAVKTGSGGAGHTFEATGGDPEAHNHGTAIHFHTASGNTDNGGVFATSASGTAATGVGGTGATGGANPPYRALHFIIKT